MTCRVYCSYRLIWKLSLPLMVNMGKLMEDPIWDVFAETEKLPRYFSGSPVAVGGWSHQQLLKNQLWTEPDFSSPPKWRGRSNQGTFFVGFVQMFRFFWSKGVIDTKELAVLSVRGCKWSSWWWRSWWWDQGLLGSWFLVRDSLRGCLAGGTPGILQEP